ASHLEMRAGNNLSISNSTILLADGKNLALVADNDSSGAGNLLITNMLTGAGNDRTILAGTSATSNATMLLQGQNVAVTDTAGTSMSVVLRGTGTQTITTPGALSIASSQIQADEGIQSTSAQTINIQGGNTFARLSGGTQGITAGAGGITVQAGTGTGNNASISHLSNTGTQTIAVTNGGTVSVNGGNAGSNNSAQISSSAAQNLNVAGGITVHAGTSPATGADARILAASGQAIGGKF